MVRLARAQRSFKVLVSNFEVERGDTIFSRANLADRIMILRMTANGTLTTNCDN